MFSLIGSTLCTLSRDKDIVKTYRQRLETFIITGGRARSMIMTGGSCPAGWNYYNGNCFYVSTTEVTQPVAHSECQAMGADLASISNQAEMDFVESIS